MKAAPLTTRPDFPLMTQSDIVSFFHLQMPRWHFSHSRYKSLSLEAKVAYTFLLNRFQLSRLNGWVNRDGEVFVIFPREALAEEMQISYRKAIECFKELAAVDLIWERRLGRGNANQIYLALVRLEKGDAEAHTSAPFSGGKPRPAKPASLRDIPAREELPGPQVKECGFDSFGPAVSEGQDLQIPHPNKTEQRKIERGEKKVSPPDELEAILENCELDLFSPEVAGVFRNAVERLYYSSSFTLGGATLPQEKVRSHLWELDGSILQSALEKLQSNRERKVKNSTAYVMAVVLNSIWEQESDLLVDPFLNSMAGPPGREGFL